jgi:hypothetical protein
VVDEQSSLFWLGIEAQKGAGSKPTDRRHWVASFVVGILIAVLIAAGAFILLASQKMKLTQSPAVTALFMIAQSPW